MFAKRSTNWKNLWDRESGFLRPRQADASWLTPFEPMSPEGMVEGNGWQYLFRVTHDISGLADRMGGRERAIERLDRLMRDAVATGFTAPHEKHHLSPLDFGNQPSTFYAHILNHLGTPEKTEFWVREIYAVCKSEIVPEGGNGGDEDQGLMGSLNVMWAIGLFDITGGCGRESGYFVNRPLFETVEIDLDSAHHEGK